MHTFTLSVLVFSVAYVYSLPPLTTDEVRNASRESYPLIARRMGNSIANGSAWSSQTARASNYNTVPLSYLFPISESESWTTYEGASDPLPVSADTFRPTKVASAVPPDYTTAPDGTNALKVHYNKGSYQLDHAPYGGVSFYAPGPESVDLTSAKEATFGYSVYVPDGFEYQLGGKLPGLYGGDSEDEAVSCSDGRRSTQCFSARWMWRTDGAGELYTYLPPYDEAGFEANQKVCSVPPYSVCNPTYGASVGRGAFSFETGAWTTITQRVLLNDAGQANGRLEVWANGKSVIDVDGLILRDSDQGAIRGIQMQSFFGGSTEDYASPQDQDLYFADFSVAITQTL